MTPLKNIKLPVRERQLTNKQTNFISPSYMIHVKHMTYFITAYIALPFKVLIKKLKTHMTSQNIALKDIKIALWDIILFIVTEIFQL